MLSMTGYGRGEVTTGGITVTVELSSVNRKQFDLRLNMPRSLAALEAEITKQVRRSVTRGSINCKITVAATGNACSGSVEVDMAAAKAAIDALRSCGRQLQLEDDLSLGVLLKIPDVVVFRDAAEDTGKVLPVLKRALKPALENLVAMRSTEGEALCEDLTKRFKRLEKTVAGISKRAPGVTAKYRENLRERLVNAGLEIDCDDERLAKEIALFADRCDISEEIVRLGSHFEQAWKLMRSSKPVGRALDFLCQEFLREINTIGSKANDSELSRLVIEFKTELETVREQVQNIE